MGTGRLIEVLRGAGLDPEARELADALWLAPFLPDDPDAMPVRSPPASTGQTGAVPGSGAEPSAVTSVGEAAPRDGQPWAQLHVPEPRPTGAGRGLPVRAPEAPALRGRSLTRSLRPLRRTASDPDRWVVDEQATAERIAEQGIWLPVLHHDRCPWYDLDLVVDAGASMAVWSPVVAELESVLRSLGAFRRIRRVSLPSHEPGRGGTGTAGEPLAVAGRRLILVISDCTGPRWHDGSLFGKLQTWARHQTVAIMQPLPQRMWSRTGLVPVRGRLSAVDGESTNARLRFAPHNWRPGRAVEVAAPVPVLQIQPDWLASWARLTGTGNGSIDAVITLPPRPRAHRPPSDEGTVEQAAERLRRFRATASPEAFRLATHLADLPVTLPVMRLVQRALPVPGHPAHLAEVLLGGLLVRHRPSGDELRFEFRPGIRPLLRSLVRHSDLVRLRHEIAAFIARQMGISLREFAAVVSADSMPESDGADPRGASLGRLPTTVLARLGGRHLALIDLFRTEDVEVMPARRTEPTPVSPIEADEPEGPWTPEGLGEVIRRLRRDSTAEPTNQRIVVNFVAALRSRFEQTGDLADLVEAVSVLEQSRAATTGPAAPRLSVELGELRLTLAVERGLGSDLAEAVSLFRSALTDADPTLHRRGLIGLARALTIRGERSGTLADLDEASTLYRSALVDAAAPVRDQAALRLVDTLLRRYTLGRDSQSLLDAMMVLTDVADESGRRSRQARLAALLRSAFRDTGEVRLLWTAAQLYEQSAEDPAATPTHLQLRVTRGLAEVLGELAVHTGDPAALERAVRVARSAVAASDEADQSYVDSLVTLVGLLRLTAAHDQRQAVLDELVAAARKLLGALPGYHPDRHHHLGDLGRALLQRYRQGGDAGDLQEACARFEEAVRCVPESGPLGERLADLADALRARAERFGSRADLDAARQALRRAIDATAPEDPGLVQRVRSLAEVLAEQGQWNEAVAGFRRAVELSGRRFGPDAAPTVETRIAFGRALLAAGRFYEAREEAQAVVEILSQRLGPDAPATLSIRDTAAKALAGSGRPDEARRELTAVLATRQRLFGDEDPTTQATREALAALPGDGDTSG